MIEENDPYTAAHQYFNQQGDESALQESMRSDTQLAAGFTESSIVWQEIIKAIEVLPNSLDLCFEYSDQFDPHMIC